MSNIPIVQGVTVAEAPKQSQQPPYGYQQAQEPPSAAAAAAGDGGGSYAVISEQELSERRQNVPKQYQDVIWAILFIAHLIAMIVFIAIGISFQGGVSSGAFGGIIFMVCVCGLAAVLLSTLALSFMMRNAEILVQTALIFSVISSLAVGIVGFMLGSMLMGVFGIIGFVVGICYAKIVWPRIPFAASNLVTALTAVRANLGLAVVAYGFTGLAFLWTVFWFLGLGSNLSENKLPVVFLLFVSYYWVHQVLQNTVHVTAAGVIGTWWFIPGEASSCWSNALTDSLFRATTYSFGSICFGSFLVAVVQALRQLEYYTRENDDLQFLACIIQCILACIQSIIEELNTWAYVYVGLYGFSFLEAGRNVIQLFQSKGWTVIITDDLAENVLFMMSVAVGLATGLIGLIVGVLQPDMFANLGIESAAGGGFLIGLLTGSLFASVLFSIVASAVNTVIVCFAEAPAEFEMNHPQLSQNMRAAWTQAWPGLFT